jgi:hypothetical protein
MPQDTELVPGEIAENVLLTTLHVGRRCIRMSIVDRLIGRRRWIWRSFRMEVSMVRALVAANRRTWWIKNRDAKGMQVQVLERDIELRAKRWKRSIFSAILEDITSSWGSSIWQQSHWNGRSVVVGSLSAQGKQGKSAPLYVNNQAAIAMVNEWKPTPRSRHIHIQHFTIQEWRATGDIELHHIPGTINASDQASYQSPWMDSPFPSRPSIHGPSSSPLASFQSSSYLYITLSCATVYSRIHGIPSLGFGEGVIAEEYNESWLVTSAISADTCDCIHPWLAPWWTHSSPCALNYIFYQLFEAELLCWHCQLPNRGGHLFSLFINR